MNPPPPAQPRDWTALIAVSVLGGVSILISLLILGYYFVTRIVNKKIYQNWLK
jgi:uncharacterized protein YneF (UPF0154 family)